METFITVDSKDRDSNLYPSGSNYVLHLSYPIRNVSRVELVSARVPNTIYNLNSTTNVFVIGTSNVTLTQGFYSASGLAAAVTNTGTIDMAYLPNEGHFIFSKTVPFDIQIVSKEFATMAGLSANVTYTATLATVTDPTCSGSYIIRSLNVIDMSMNEYVYLDIEELKTPSHISTGSIVGSTGTVTGSNAGRSFAPVLMNVGSACIKTFQESSDYKISVEYPEPINVLSRLTVRWYDKNGTLLNFRGLETNAFVLRAIIKEDPRRLPPPPPLHDVELKRIIDAMSMVPEKVPEKKRKIPWVLITLALILGLFVYKTFFNASPQISAPVSQPLHSLPVR